MIDPQARQVALNIVESELRDRRRLVAQQLGAMTQELVSKGVLNSTVAQSRASEIIRSELVARAELVWRTFAKVLDGDPALEDPAIGAELKRELSSVLEATSDDLSDRHEWATNLIAGPRGIRPLDEMVREASQKVAAEIDLALMKARRASGSRTAPKSSGTPLTIPKGGGAPKVFVSYAWESEQLKNWVRDTATRLRSKGVDVMLDQWNAVPGDQLPAFMERAVRDNDFVLIVCTPTYREKSNSRKGGVGYEGDIMTAELVNSGNHRKFIPLLRLGAWRDSAPSWLAGKYYIDLCDGPRFEDHFADLLATLHGQQPAAPPLGPSPFAKPTDPGAANMAPPTTVPPADSVPIRIVGIIADEVTAPRNDGTRGSALYRIPFRLSQTPPAGWAQLFAREWDHPSSFTSRHRPGIARVEGDRIVLDGTTIEEVEEVHRETLKTVLNDVNARYQQVAGARITAEEARAKAAAEHAQRVKDAADRLRFD